WACSSRTWASENVRAVRTIGSARRANRSRITAIDSRYPRESDRNPRIDPGVDERARRGGKRRQEGACDFVTAWIDVANVRPRVVSPFDSDHAPQREGDLDPVLEYERLARFEEGDRTEDERNRKEAQSAKGPQSLGTRDQGPDQERDHDEEKKERDRHRVRGDRAVRVQERPAFPKFHARRSKCRLG